MRGGRLQVFQARRRIDPIKPHLGSSLYIDGKPLRVSAIPNLLCFLATVAFEHRIDLADINACRY